MEDFATLKRQLDEQRDLIDTLAYNLRLKTGPKASSIVSQDVSIGGEAIQYKISDDGIFTFGDGSDGAGVADGSTALAGASLAANVYTLSRDVYYTNLTVSTGVTIKPAGYRIFGTGTLTLQGTAIISRNGNAGTAGTVNGNAAAGGGALADGYLKGSPAGGNGGTGSAGAGVAGGNTTNSIGSSGSAGGVGNGAGANGGAGGTATAANVSLRAGWHLQTFLDVGSTGAPVKYDNSAAGGGGGNGLVSGGSYGGGGGAGSGGGIIVLCFRVISVGASASITATGGVGGAGAESAAASGGGGAGGNGGQVILVYNTLSNLGTISMAGGVGGARGAATATAGTDGVIGTKWEFQISL